jgi:Rod binding domain-containing protein
MEAGLQNAMLAARPVPPQATANAAKADAAAKDYESVFIAQFLGSMFSGIGSNSLTGGGQGEEMFRSLMVDQYAKGLEAQGGFCLADSMKAQLLKMQGGGS